MEIDENACIENVLRGDALAYEPLVKKYQARLIAFLWNLLGSGEEARDAAQEALIKAYVSLGRFDRSRSFKTWLFAIAYHSGIDLLRRRRHVLALWKHAAGECLSPAATTVVQPLEASPLWQPFLIKITAQERSVLALKYNEDLGTNEIAATLGCSESTVRVHMLNARRKLKKELKAAGFVSGLTKAKAEEAL